VQRPALRGTIVALLSALAFGLTTPLVQRLSRGTGAFTTAALLYAGAALVGIATRSRSEAPLRREHAPRIALLAAFGALLAPAALAWGLARASGTAASLMLNLEGVFTLALARVFHHEHVGRRVAFAAGVMLLGGAMLVFDRSPSGAATASTIGLAAIAIASLGWAIDNTLAKPLAALDPSAVVAAKAVLGALLSTVAALVLGERWPEATACAGLVVVGATGYGFSLRLYLRAQRALGAGRTGSVFASAPFWGAALAWALGEHAGGLTLVAAALMIVGLVLHLTEHHSHAHVHEPLEHEHPHTHDDGHHDHVHDPMPAGAHTHPHRHDRVEHEHPHVPDLHHEHGHVHGHVNRSSVNENE
jgi:drug/metabolite transporter (DMT)-like permease